ncbi:cyd operon protein YbgT [Methylobacter tundripaludum]|jgi:cyd operon protein YbgT|uniref:diguanylate cyclase n=1 Tax=Methylobacter tundripaludum TaxID=173365 RepID=A0A2S6GZK6_9GAMM|nr:cyd operon protein YbgT [Methylobacter tundripaludum]
MWYFTWILGLLLACSLGIINVLRLEAQETWDREHIPLDPLTQLMTKDMMLGRLKEKVENSKRNGFPFSILFISLKDFKAKNNLPAFEMDAILRNVADCFQGDIRAGVDIAARMDEQDFLIAMPGSPLKKAEEIAAQIKNEISKCIKAPGLAVEIATGVAEYSAPSEESAATTDEVDELIRIATAKSGS